jgi:23S rRNA pseudouridine1911/1915/1917 synthase
MEEITLIVDEVKVRLDRYVAERCPRLSRSSVQRLIKEGRLTVNGAPARASYLPVPGDEITLRVPDAPPPPLAMADVPLRVVYEDAYLLVIDKHPGVVVHPSPGHESGTLVNAVLAYRPDVAQADVDPLRPGIVHRLDRDTSGLMLIAAQRETQLALQEQFKAHQVLKVYVALVQGRLLPWQGAIEAPIARDPHDRTRMAIAAKGGRYARTEYEVVEHLPGCTLLRARPLTGRTHQLRVHFSSIGHAVVGDALYGHQREPREVPRQFLHASQLTVTHPATGEVLTLTSELPDDLAKALALLRARA